VENNPKILLPQQSLKDRESKEAFKIRKSNIKTLSIEFRRDIQSTKGKLKLHHLQRKQALKICQQELKIKKLKV